MRITKLKLYSIVLKSKNSNWNTNFCNKKNEKIFELENKDSGDQITLSVPKDAAEGYINNKKEEYRFRYATHILDVYELKTIRLRTNI